MCTAVRRRLGRRPTSTSAVTANRPSGSHGTFSFAAERNHMLQPVARGPLTEGRKAKLKFGHVSACRKRPQRVRKRQEKTGDNQRQP